MITNINNHESNKSEGLPITLLSKKERIIINKSNRSTRGAITKSINKRIMFTLLTIILTITLIIIITILNEGEASSTNTITLTVKTTSSSL